VRSREKAGVGGARADPSSVDGADHIFNGNLIGGPWRFVGADACLEGAVLGRSAPLL